MSGCGFSQRRLQAWLDGEAAGDVQAVASHVAVCGLCAAQVNRWRRAGAELRQIIDDAVGEVEPLTAIGAIHRRIAEQQATPWRRAMALWRDLWDFNRRAVAGVATAAALGVVLAPAVLMWQGPGGQAVSSTPVGALAVVVEALEFDPSRRPVVYHPDAATTVIWLEPSFDGESLQ